VFWKLTLIEYFSSLWQDVLLNNNSSLFEFMTFETLNKSQRSIGLPVGLLMALYCLFYPSIISV